VTSNFQGFGLIIPGEPHFWIALDEARVNGLHRYDVVRRLDLFRLSRAWFDKALIGVRVMVEGSIDENGLIIPFHIAPAPRLTSSAPPQQEEKAHDEFKAGLEKGMQIAIDFLRKLAGKHFQANEDSLASKLREYATCLGEEQQVQRKTSYPVR